MGQKAYYTHTDGHQEPRPGSGNICPTNKARHSYIAGNIPHYPV